jgi:hypothetical protein
LAEAVAALQEQNRQYVTLGLDWKKRYEEAKHELTRLAAQTGAELQELQRLVGIQSTRSG